MQYRTLGNAGIEVSLIGLGTMTWGEQNTEAEAFEQLDYALEQGVNLIDAAEMYPVPPRAETQGRTETYIGRWLQARGCRDRMVLATKVAGPADIPWLRGGPQLVRDQMERALNDSLQRLQTDYVDLYQVHWPSRSTNFFGQLGYRHQSEEAATGIAEMAAVLEDFVRRGRVRAIGISNETPWGLMQWLRASEQGTAPRVASIQNPYNLLNRSFEAGLAEMAIRERVGLLAYSPLAFGTLTGKYLGSVRPAGARLTRFERFSRYSNPQGIAATEEYAALARAHGLTPAQMALAFINHQPFVTSNLVGATSVGQLAENIASVDLTLDHAVLAGIEEIHARFTYPCP
ncbi:Oxidoreductase, aldo/keto reductase family [Thioalkalivibrio nitratireducens DSM 14787]|uniref:Protein tas n=1 Tax=Thioalkalivibrio nitratireducens (strain DSM 14787 / UNIQEM 213 / ALEN2) TaxID=1255043 RepID=L0E0B6_THIND|nr:NADP(H)-dependent aldo-keto reductase [Thioalkalivibrio nitratireducens]AGA35279.1 Oxidoreductase, aldo/keto reductase family [Thioalkalivibrio nitratireducens DSM 14787]